MSDPAMVGGDPEMLEASTHRPVTNEGVGVPIADSDDTLTTDAREAEVVEEQHLDERHATGEHFTGNAALAEDDPLLNLDEDKR